MNKRMSTEAIFGIGGGNISAESQRNLKIAEDLCRKRKPDEAAPYIEKAMEDPRNLDAWISAAFVAPNLDISTGWLEEAEKQGRVFLKKDFGPTCFDDDGGTVGDFWTILETRPYMRVLSALVRIHKDNGKFDKSANVAIEMLRLCPADNTAQRDGLGALLIKAGRHSDALSFVQNWLASNTAQTGVPPPRGGCNFGQPSREPLSPKRVKELCDGCLKADRAYSAALAAYHLWGDCELARQYLLIGAKLNPQVLLKILAKVNQPKSTTSAARSLNSTEDAHDYLWLCQDSFMEPKIWNWINSNAEVRKCILKKCSRAGCKTQEIEVAQFKRCGSCHQVWYCSPQCQKDDWKTHKPSALLYSAPPCIYLTHTDSSNVFRV
ncbi:hypothetical protein PHLCEN_2v10596 [Hermanssonia centrifuga]|uniref:MYND-type domain-containing protein n=1 Tax=Hermanssonia centrifuga TaxID=98765 RepID=A0A2R6NMQ8_9APHY|nr:hypothetical protein PHLCEN_2v10596 [Hermanssonia centrifuga]